MTPHVHSPPPFRVVDCALVTRVTGRSAQNLRELRDALLNIDTASIYNHFWGGLLRPHFDDPELHNDFAVWARKCLHDRVLAERLAAVDPADYGRLEDMRIDLVDICEDRLAEVDMVPWAPRDHTLHFQSAHIVVFDTGRLVERPEELATALPRFSRGSVFYHFVDARRRNENGYDDLRRWLTDCGPAYRPLVELLGAVDPLQGSLHDLKHRVAAVVGRFRPGGGV